MCRSARSSGAHRVIGERPPKYRSRKTTRRRGKGGFLHGSGKHPKPWQLPRGVVRAATLNARFLTTDPFAMVPHGEPPQGPFPVPRRPRWHFFSMSARN